VARTRERVQTEDRNHKATVIERHRDEVDDDIVESGRKDRPTPSAREARTARAPSGLIDRIPVVRSVAAYLRGVVSEIQKVTWPTREETQRLTLIVLAVTAAFAIGLGLLTTFYSWWFQQAFHADSEWIFLVVSAIVAVVSGGAYALFRKQI